MYIAGELERFDNILFLVCQRLYVFKLGSNTLSSVANGIGLELLLLSPSTISCTLSQTQSPSPSNLTSVILLHKAFAARCHCVELIS